MSLPQWQNRPVSWVLLDRDGVINRDSPDYVRSVEQWQPLEGSIEAMARLHAAGCRLLLITNQSGIGRGYYERAELFAMHRKMARLLADASAQVEAVLFCPHLPDQGCDCRKPAPGMLRRAMACFGFAADQAVMIGDSERDISAATGIQVNAVRVGNSESAEFSSLAAWVDQLLGTNR